MTNDFCQEENWPIAMIDLRRSLCTTLDILISYKLVLNLKWVILHSATSFILFLSRYKISTTQKEDT